MSDPLDEFVAWLDQAVAGLPPHEQAARWRSTLIDAVRSGLATAPEQPQEPSEPLVVTQRTPRHVWDRLDATERALKAVLRQHPEAKTLRAVQAWDRLNKGAA